MAKVAKTEPAFKKPPSTKGPKHIHTYEEVVAHKNATDIIAQMEQWVSEHSLLLKDYTYWYIGVEDFETTTKGLKHLKSMKAEDMDTALAVETYFHNKGMKTTFYKGGISAKTTHVYIHKNN